MKVGGRQCVERIRVKIKTHAKMNVEKMIVKQNPVKVKIYIYILYRDK